MGNIDRVNAELMKQITLIIRELKHPQINGIITVTGVETGSDLTYAKVRVSVMNAVSEKKDIIKALNHSAGYIRRELKSRVTIRTIPELSFISDENIEYALRISKLIEEVNKDTKK
jgi:ribosome-binding factor A